MKRSLDLISATFVLTIGFPIIISLIILDFIILNFVFLLRGKGSYLKFLRNNTPLFRQMRAVSLAGKRIKILKIRTIIEMDVNNEEEKKKWGINNGRYSNKIPLFFKWMRKSGFDEILQFWNVLKGEMSLIGPRPLIINELKKISVKYPEMELRRKMLKSLPGITGYWQVFGEKENGIEDLLEKDEYYEKNKSFILDLKIIFRTIKILITASHSDAIIRYLE